MKTRTHRHFEPEHHQGNRHTVITICLLVLAATVAQPAPPSPYLAGELLVKFNGGPRSRAAEQARQSAGHDVKRDFDFIGWQHIRLPQSLSVEQGLGLFRAMPGVLAVEPNYIENAVAYAVPSDPAFNLQWSPPKISAPEAWDLCTGSSNIVVAVIDSGINYNHEELQANMWRNPGEIPANGLDDDNNGYVDDIYGIDTADDFYGNDSDPLDQGADGTYHGSSCAGIIGAAGNNSIGIAGLNWSVQLMALRSMRTNGSLSATDTIEALEYCALMKQRGVNLKALNLSYGTTNYSQALSDSYAAVGDLGILLVAAAGNSSKDLDVIPGYPSGFSSPAIVAVAATDQTDNLAYFTSGEFANYGRTNVDLAAPGVGIRTTTGPGTNSYGGFNGSSAACPHVAGAAALMFALNPNATVGEVKAALIETVDLIPALTNKMVAHGRLNLTAALQHMARDSYPSNAEPHIVCQPKHATVLETQPAAFSVWALGHSLYYQWQHNGQNIPGVTDRILNRNSVTAELDSGDYTVVVSNSFGAVTSQVAVLSVLRLSPLPQSYLGAFPAGLSNQLGSSIAASGDTLVVGASLEDSTAVDSGAVYVYVRDGANWALQARLKASNAGTGDQFGFSVGISGGTIVASALGEDSNATGVNGDGANNNAVNSGAVYVFVRSGTNWIQQAYLKAANTGAGDQFGAAVAIDANTVVVAANREDSDATGVDGDANNNSAVDSGAAYVFVRDGATWSQQAYLKASNTESNDLFGWSVAISGQTILVGSLQEDSNATGVNGNQANNSRATSGAAYVFVRDGTTWSQQAYLKASNTDSIDQFGVSVAIHGDTAVVGANREDSSGIGVNGFQGEGAADSGAAYVFRREGITWSQQAYLKAPNPGVNDQFARSVAVQGNLIIVGAPAEDSAAVEVNGIQNDNTSSDSGAAYVFARSGTNWVWQTYLKPSYGHALARFGWAVAVLPHAVACGAPGQNYGQTSAGSVYVFDLNIRPYLFLDPDTNNTCTVRFHAIPGWTYELLSAATVDGPWSPLGLSLAPPTGVVSFHDTNAPSSQSFYRVKLH